jgi:hypothetical protein
MSATATPMVDRGKLTQFRVSKHTTNDKYRAFCYFVWKLFPFVSRLAKSLDRVAAATFTMSRKTRHESQKVREQLNLSINTGVNADQLHGKGAWEGVLAEARLLTAHLNAELDIVDQNAEHEQDRYQKGLAGGQVASPAKLECGPNGPAMSVARIDQLFGLIETIAQPTEISCFLDQGKESRRERLSRGSIRVLPVIIMQGPSALRYDKPLAKGIQDNAVRGAGASAQPADVLVQPWWRDGRWQAAVLSRASSEPIISTVDPWNELQAPPTGVCVF